MAGKNSKLMTRDTSKINRTFSYQKGSGYLDFTIRVDVKQHLKDFKECLEAALKDVAEEIARKR